MVEEQGEQRRVRFLSMHQQLRPHMSSHGKNDETTHPEVIRKNGCNSCECHVTGQKRKHGLYDVREVDFVV